MHGVDDFLILEATDRIGGRMRHMEFEGYTIELGANWIEGVGGEKQNPIWALAKEHNLTISYADFDHVFANTYDQESVIHSVHSL
jgi:polyamine oxidase